MYAILLFSGTLDETYAFNLSSQKLLPNFCIHNISLDIYF